MGMETAELEQLLDVTALLTSTLDLNAVLTQVLRNAEKLMQAEASNVMLLDPDGRYLLFEVALGTAGGAIKEQRRLKIGVGIAGWVAENNQPLLIEDAYQDPRFFPDFDKKTGFKTKSIVCLPLQARGKLIGIAQIINKKGGGVFTPEDQARFTRYCHVAAIAIDNALLHRRKTEQERLHRDMQLAEEIQRATWPSHVPSFPKLRVEYRTMACRYVGGDLLEVDKLPDGRLSVLVGDVSGKGMPAALFGAKFNSDFEYQSRADWDAGVLFTKLNSIVARRSTRGMFITAVFAVIDPEDGSVELVNAGHLVPVIVGPEKGRLRRVETTGFPPLGIVEDTVYETSRLKLAPGERIIFMTDGVVDAKNLEGARLGELAADHALQKVPALAVARLMRTIKSFTTGQPLADDITVVGVGYGNYEELELSSDTTSLAHLRRFIEGRVKGYPVGSKSLSRMELAVTEAMANVIEHTYKMDPAGRMVVGAGWDDTTFFVHIRDWGPKQDPTRFVSRDLEDVEPGGLGIHYIKATADAVEFDESLLEGNELHLMFSPLEALKV